MGTKMAVRQNCPLAIVLDINQTKIFLIIKVSQQQSH